MDDALVLTTSYEGIEQAKVSTGWNRVRARAGMARTWGDCYGHALVATGRAEAMFDPVMSVWDAAALRPIIEEAGGVFTDWRGQATHLGGSVVSTNAALARELRMLLNESA
jgi:fructose-1,6-bisphosphatase/inositol monophosphatase family enzyme